MATTTTADVTGGVSIAGTAGLAFVDGSDPALSDIVLEVDLDNDGDFDEPEEQLTGYFISGESLTGRDEPSPVTGRAVPGHGRFELLNIDDVFSPYNTASPLKTAPFNLGPGCRIRVRTATSTPADPVLLARDRFKRPDGALGAAESGQTWTNRQGSFTVAGQVASASADFSTYIVSTLDAGATAYYVQATLRQVHPSSARNVGLVVRYTDINNWVFVHYDCSARQVRIWQWSAGVLNTIATGYPLEGWEGMTLGAGVVGSTVTAYVGGAPVTSGTAGVSATTNVGIAAYHGQYSGRSPELGDFHVWDRVAAEVEGILWTGTVTNVKANVAVGALKTATIDAEGVLSTAAKAEVASPRLAVAGAPTGLIVGDILNRASLLNPPGRIDVGTITTGPVGIDDGKALTLARRAEETERGFLYEANEGGIGFMGAAARATATPQAWFSDGDAGQFHQHVTEPLDSTSFLVNQVTAGVAADAPSGVTVTQVTGTGNVDITMPTVAAGDLLVVFIASSTNASGERWLTPLFWQSHRDAGTATGMRVYSHWCDGTEGGSTVIFYANSGAASGLFVAEIYRVQGWFQSPKGIAVGDVVSGNNPGALVHGWGRVPTLFIVVASAITSGSAIVFDPNFDPPDGYPPAAGVISSSGVAATEVGIAYTHKIDCTESEDPTEFPALTGGLISESVVFAVRGYNGPHTKATLQDPNTTGGDGRFVTVDDLGSQDDHNAIIPLRDPSNLFATEAAADAYGDAVLAAASGTTPAVQISFWASRSAAYRAQAIRRRVGHKIHLTADGETGLGIDGGFFIETVAHRWDKGQTLWETTWQLSPA